MIDAKTFDAIIDAGNTEPSQEKTFPWKKVEPYIPTDEFTEALNRLRSYRNHPHTEQFVLNMSKKVKNVQ